MKKLLFLLVGLALATFSSKAQLRCGTDAVNSRLKAEDPGLAATEARLEQEIKQRIFHTGLGQFAKGTDVNTDTIYHIPVVFHIVHDYAWEYIPDDTIYAVMADLNRMYSRTNGDSAGIISKYSGFIPGTNILYRGKANIQFHLATIDPSGHPTHGITRHHSYLTRNGGDQSKLDQWPPSSYLNIWVIRSFSPIGNSVNSYAYTPSMAASNPYADGVISLNVIPAYIVVNNDHDVSHQIGHMFNLEHTFGGLDNPTGTCGDDGVDDTPPTKGHIPMGCTPYSLSETSCANGYFKTYTSAESQALFGDTLHHIIDYPDTVNSQNVMDMTFCSRMFTYGQVLRMRAALNSPIAGRNHLKSTANLINTGALLPHPDLPPIADFDVSLPFICADGGTQTTFTNRSWNDTITNAAWSFSNGAVNAISTNLSSVNNGFTVPGWVTASLSATGNHTGANMITKKLVYAADTLPVNPDYYFMSFGDSNEAAKWPIFDYYGTDHKWEIVHTAGVDDNNSIRFANVDTRSVHPGQWEQTSTPSGVYADFYSRGFDLTNITVDSKLTFAFAGAYRTTNVSEMNDRLFIHYSDDCGSHWNIFDSISRTAIPTAGYVGAPFIPNASNWKWFGSSLGRISNGSVHPTFFRFRFISGVDNYTNLFGTGNNFYLDRININNYPVGIDPMKLSAEGIIVSPNPTSGNATVTIESGESGIAQLLVTDITGRMVYQTEVHLSNSVSQVVIPADRISVKGLYQVHMATQGKAVTRKLLVF